MGFATLIEGETDLARALGTAADCLRGVRAVNTARIFRHQVRQIEAIISLLLERRSEFPIPHRFEIDAAQHPHTSRALAPKQPLTLDGIRSRHLAFATHLEELVASTASSSNREDLLREAKQRHEEMAWMLSALINEDLTAARPVLSVPRNSPAVGNFELERWENEGGGVIPGSTGSGAMRPAEAGGPLAF